MMNKILGLWMVLICSGFMGWAAEGRLLWKEHVLVEVAGGPAIFGDTAAVVTRSGLVFVFDHRGKLLGRHDIKAAVAAGPSFDEQGRLWLADLDGQVWRFSKLGESTRLFTGGKPFRATPLQAQGQVIVCDESGDLVRLDVADGRELGRLTLGKPVFSSGVILGDGSLLQPSKDYTVFRVSPDNRAQVWFSGSGVLFSSPALMGDGRVALTSMDHHLYLLKSDGKAQFRFKSQRWVICSPVIDEGGRIFFGSYDKHFYAVNPDGKMAWRIDGQGGFNASPVIDGEGVVYTGDASGRVYAVSAGGIILWQYRTGDYVRSPLGLFRDHAVLLVASLDGYLYALEAQAPLSQKALWPTYLGNERRSGRR
jgi:outer membrane protein assembly factor BamB